MSKLLNISDAASLAMHSLVLLARNPRRRMTTREIAERLVVSQNHLSKVLQRLHKAGLVKSLRGPGGGFVLGREAEAISLLEVYEEFDGPFNHSTCLFRDEICLGENCILGGLISHIGKEFRDYLAKTRVSELRSVLSASREEGARETESKRGGRNEKEKINYSD